MTNKPFIYSIGCSILMSPFLATPSGAVAAPSEYATVTADVLNVRSYPSSGSSIIGKLFKHKEVTVLAEKDGWAKITYENKEGWVSSSYIQKGKKTASKVPAKPASTPQTGYNAFVKASKLNVRSAPSTNGDIIASLPNQTKVIVLTEKGGWAQIKTAQNQIGWVAGHYLTKTASPNTGGAAKPAAAGGKVGTVTASNLNVRSSASIKGTIVATLPKNTKVSILSIQGSWVHIKMDNKKTGWVASSYLTISQGAGQPAQPEAKPPVPAPATSKTGIVNVTSLNLRALPSTSAQVLTSLPKNTIVTILKVQSGWAQVKTSANQTGWVAFPYVTVKEASNKPVTPMTPALSVTLKSNANLRKGPGTNYSIVGSGQAGTTYTLIKEQNEWINIRLSNGQEAWVAGWLVTKGNTAPTAPTAPPSIPADILKGKRIVIDAGHGGKDSGTVGQKGSLEKTLALNTAKLVVAMLEKAGANVVMTRDDDTFISLSGRVNVSHQHNADAFISIHYNAAGPSANGIMSFYYSAEKERQLAKAIQESLIKYTNRKDMGVRFGNFHVIRENKKPAVLLELGFLSNQAEEQVVKSDAFQQNAAKAIYEGIIRYFEQL